MKQINTQVVTARYENGVLKPDQPLKLRNRARVRLIVEPVSKQKKSDDEAWEEIERMWKAISVHSGGKHMTRDELHERD